MRYIALPISVTKCDWDLYIKNVEEELGYSPTRSLDKAYIPLDDPISFAATTNLNNDDPIDALSNSNGLLHVSITFLFIIDRDCLTDLVGHDLVVSFKEQKRKVLAVVTGNMSQWLQFIKTAKEPETTIDLANQIKTILKQTCMKHLL